MVRARYPQRGTALQRKGNIVTQKEIRATSAQRCRPYRIMSSLPAWTLLGSVANVARLVIAVVWTFAWGTGRLVKYSDFFGWHPLLGPSTWRQSHLFAFSWGRHDSPKAMWCERCGWVGPLRWAIHTYAGCGDDDVEPVDECPRCGSESLNPVLMRRNGAWGS